MHARGHQASLLTTSMHGRDLIDHGARRTTPDEINLLHVVSDTHDILWCDGGMSWT